MSRPVLRARSSVELPEPRLSRALIETYKIAAPAYLRLALKFRSIRLLGERIAAEEFRAFRSGESRLLIAFRHPYGDEPQLLASVIAKSIPASARRLGIPLPAFTYARFVHGHEVALWGGPFVRWLLPRVGAVPIHHVKFDSKGMERLRRLMIDGDHPLALAPEGQVSYTSERVPRLERGFATMAFRCAEDLEAAGRAERVTVLPISVHYRYGSGGPRLLERLLTLLEKECGIVGARGTPPVPRLRAAAEAIVAAAEAFYGELDRSAISADSSINERWTAVREAALRAGERALRLSSDGDAMRRLYRIRQAGWDRLYRDDLPSRRRKGAKPAELPSPLRRALMDREAGEGWYAMRHMELADIGSYLDFEALGDDAEVDSLIETAYNYWDLTSRLRGGNISDRLNLAPKDAVVVAGEPLELRSRLGAYRSGRKAALEAATRDLEERYMDCIDSYRKEYGHGE